MYIASLHNRLLLLLGRQPTSIQLASAHIRGFTKPDLLNFVNVCWPAGYKLVEWGGSNYYPFPPILAKPLAHLFPSMSWVIFLFFEKVKVYHDEFIKFPEKENLETNFYAG